MFDTSLPDPGALATTDDHMVVAAITGWARVEAAASARRLAAIAELVRRRADGPTECAHWSCDNWDAMAAQVGAALGVSHGMASGQMYLSVALRDRLPKVAALFADGMINARLVAAMVWRTDLITDEQALRLVDTGLAEVAITFGPLSVNKTEEAIDSLVDRHDPAALRRANSAARGREVVIDSANAQAGTTNLWGTLYCADAAVLDRRLMQMAHHVCAQDPRTIAQRRADALGALAAGAHQLTCGCGGPDCPGAPDDGERAANVVIHVVAEAAALNTPAGPATSGQAPTPHLKPAPPRASTPAPAPALIVGAGIVPTPLLAQLVRGGATIRALRHPGDAGPEPSYRPSSALDEFVRCRDLTCRFPHCDRPAEFCDVDHTIAYSAGGLTHASNLKCVCRKHHLLKTFWAGAHGWRDEQLPDGAVIWTAPTGQTYTTHPGSRLLFPTLCLPTGELPASPTPQRPHGDRALMMPRRRRTRDQDRARRIDAERALNNAHVAERNQPPPF